MKIKKTHAVLLLFVLLGAGLRIIAAHNLDVNPDEMIYTVIPVNIISAGRLSTVEQAPLFFYLTDIGYQLFGFSSITARLPAILFGSLSIVLVFLIVKLLFQDDRKSLISAFLFSISGYAILNNLEMDITAFFFLLLSIYFYMLFILKKAKYLYLSTIALGLGLLSKPFVALIIPVYVVFYLIHSFRSPEKALFSRTGEKTTEENIIVNRKMVLLFFVNILLLLLIVSPVLVYNYLLYSDKGITDFYFTTMLGIGENIYEGLGGQKPWALQRAFDVARNLSASFLKYDAVLFILGLSGMISLCFRKNQWAYFFGSYLLFHLLYTGGRTGSSSHFVILILILSLFSGHSFVALAEKISGLCKRSSVRKGFWLVLGAMGVLNVIFLAPQITPTSSIVLLEQFSSRIPDQALVVVDPLVYRGIYAWAFQDKHYLEGTYFPPLMEQLQNIPGEKTVVPLYYISCGRNSLCGWKPEDYARAFNFSESLRSYFRENLQFVEAIKGSDVLTFEVYEGSVGMPLGAYDAVDQTHQYYFYPVGWKYKELAVDNYALGTIARIILEKLGFVVLFADVLIAIFSIGAVFYVLWKRSD